MPGNNNTLTNRQHKSSADRDRWVKPQDTASLMSYLASDEAASINGAGIPVYGLV
jgi:NAD(P)-dependent dehydrogenase (short-subunit alcohol dehydrogenase family)